jgi:hypothetical protein
VVAQGQRRCRLSLGTHFPRKRLWLVLVIVGLCIILRECFLRPATNFPGARFNLGTNAVWVGVEWVNQPHDVEEVLTLANLLREYQIRYVFAYTSYLKPDGQFNPTYSYANQFIQTLKAIQPDLSVQAWIGLPLGYVDLSNNTVRRQIAEFCVTLVREKGFDGVHLDPEPVSSNDGDLLELLSEVRDALGAETTLSIAARRIWPIFPDVEWPIIGRVAWHASYYHEVASRVDQVAVMTYDSTIPSAALYCHWSRFQVIEVSRAVNDTNTEVFFGVPTSEERTCTHWPGAENMRSGLQGIVDGLNDAKAHSSAVTGVAIYPYWDTDETEWVIYQTLWLGQESPEVTSSSPYP